MNRYEYENTVRGKRETLMNLAKAIGTNDTHSFTIQMVENNADQGSCASAHVSVTAVAS